MNQIAIMKAIKFLVDGVKDIMAAAKPGQNLFERIKDFANLIPDAVDELGVIGDLQAELKALKPSDIPALAALVVQDLGLPAGKANDIVNAALAVLEKPSIQSIEGLIKAIEEPNAPVAA